MTTRVNLILDDETLAILDRMAEATEGRADMNRSSLVRALAKGAEILPDTFFANLPDGHGEAMLAFMIRAFLAELARRAQASECAAPSAECVPVAE